MSRGGVFGNHFELEDVEGERSISIIKKDPDLCEVTVRQMFRNGSQIATFYLNQKEIETLSEFLCQREN